MKKYIFRYTEILLVLSAFFALLLSCNKKNILIDNTYPNQVIYMPQAETAIYGGGNGIYSITPNIESQPHRYILDVPGAKFNILLGILRSGVNAKGAYTVSIAANNDTVARLITAKKFAVATDSLITTELLPAGAYTLPPSAVLNDGSNNATFTLGLDLNFLLKSIANTPKKRYALAVGISNSDKITAVNAALSTTVIFIDPQQVLLPAANFITYIYKETKTANFLNISANAQTYSWNFGDGTPAVSDLSPSHIYAASGTYTVGVTATGITGSANASVKTTVVVIQ